MRTVIRLACLFGALLVVIDGVPAAVNASSENIVLSQMTITITPRGLPNYIPGYIVMTKKVWDRGTRIRGMERYNNERCHSLTWQGLPVSACIRNPEQVLGRNWEIAFIYSGQVRLGRPIYQSRQMRPRR